MRGQTGEIARDAVAMQAHVTGSGFVKTGQTVEQGRFASTVGADDGGHLPVERLKGYAIDSSEPAETHGQLIDIQEDGRGRGWGVADGIGRCVHRYEIIHETDMGRRRDRTGKHYPGGIDAPIFITQDRQKAGFAERFTGAACGSAQKIYES